MKIAILGWGSLLWEERPEFNRTHEAWNYDGPVLRIEFSRISASRAGALTLVIDEQHGTPTRVAWCLSKRSRLDEVILDLCKREDSAVQSIGSLVHRSGHSPAVTDGSVDMIGNWLSQQDVNAVVWTALPSNFEVKTGTPFSTEAAVKYVTVLDREAKLRSVEYVRRAPNFVSTPIRRTLEEQEWFRDWDDQAHGTGNAVGGDAWP